MRAHESSYHANPWPPSMAVASLVLVAIGGIVIAFSKPDYNEVIWTGALIGGALVSVGAWLGIAYIVVSALLWRPDK